MAKGTLVKERDAQVTRQRLIKASLGLIASQGYHSTKISDIVRQCSVTQATFYWHFPSKLELVLEILVSGRDSLLSTLRRGYRSQITSVSDMVNNSKVWLTDLLDYADENREFMAILLGRGYSADPQIDAAIAQTRASMFEELSLNIGRAVQLGMLPDTPGDARGALVHRLIEGTLEWWLFGNGHDLNHRSTLTSDQLAEQLVSFEFFGLCGIPVIQSQQ